MRKTAYALLLAALTAPFGVHAKYNPPKDVPQVSYAQKIARRPTSSLRRRTRTATVF